MADDRRGEGQGQVGAEGLRSLATALAIKLTGRRLGGNRLRPERHPEPPLGEGA